MKTRPAAQPKTSGTPADAVGDVAEIEDTTSATTVAYKPTQEPAAETANASASKLRPALVKLAASPALKQDDPEKWIKEVKTRAAMRSRDRGSNVMSVINARF